MTPRSYGVRRRQRSPRYSPQQTRMSSIQFFLSLVSIRYMSVRIFIPSRCIYIYIYIVRGFDVSYAARSPPPSPFPSPCAVLALDVGVCGTDRPTDQTTDEPTDERNPCFSDLHPSGSVRRGQGDRGAQPDAQGGLRRLLGAGECVVPPLPLPRPTRRYGVYSYVIAC